MMTTSQAAVRRAEWKQRAYRRRCMHVVLELECNEQGYVTGNYVCNFCGECVAQEHLVALHPYKPLRNEDASNRMTRK